MTYKEKFESLPNNFFKLCEEAGLLAEYQVAAAAARGKVSKTTCELAANNAETTYDKTVLSLKRLNNLLSGESSDQWEHRCGADWNKLKQNKETALTLLAFFRHKTMRCSTQCK